LIFILFLILLQTGFFVFFSFFAGGYWGAVLILTVLGILLFSEKPSRNSGFILAFFTGFFMDIFSGCFFGFYTLIAMAIAFAIKFILRQYLRN